MALALLLTFTSGSARAYDVAVCASSADASDVQAKLLATGEFDSVDLLDAGAMTPSLADLMAYHALLVFSDEPFEDATGLGDNLASYLNAGPGIVFATFSFDDGDLGIGGELVAEDYLPFTTGEPTSGVPLTLLIDDPGHALMAGVSTFDGGPSSFHHGGIIAAQGTTTVAHWSNEEPLVATSTATNSVVVGLNFFPPSSDVRPDLWDATTDGARLMANALSWVARFPDYDHDGWSPEDGDCDDYNANVYPGAQEIPYNGVDEDCDGADWDDMDGDGFAGGHYGEDCDDWDPSTHPEAVEDCADGVDNDCDGLVDEYDPECEEETNDPDGEGTAEHEPHIQPDIDCSPPRPPLPPRPSECQCRTQAGQPLPWVMLLLASVFLNRRFL